LAAKNKPATDSNGLSFEVSQEVTVLCDNRIATLLAERLGGYVRGMCHGTPSMAGVNAGTLTLDIAKISASGTVISGMTGPASRMPMTLAAVTHGLDCPMIRRGIVAG
jgi:hypothetical protein